MKLDLTINGLPESIELLASGPECSFRLGEGEERRAGVETPEPGVFSVLLDGRSYEARIEEHPNTLVVVIDGFRFEIDVRDPRRMARRADARGREDIETITAPMPGKVVRVLIAPGDTVEAGQGLLVVEAMKMQNEMKASRPGRVATLPAKEGATVAAGEVLATIE
jgi:biotin carboxyl carrier protein